MNNKKNKVKVPDFLTKREKETFLNILKGKNNQEISKEMGITYATARLMSSKVLQKLNVENKFKLIAKYK